MAAAIAGQRGRLAVIVTALVMGQISDVDQDRAMALLLLAAARRGTTGTSAPMQAEAA